MSFAAENKTVYLWLVWMSQHHATKTHKWNEMNETKQNENHRAHWRECDEQCYKLIYRYPNLKTMLTYSIENFANSDLIGIFVLPPFRKVNSIIISGAIWINWHMAVKIATKHALYCQYAILSKSQQMIKLFLNFCALSRSRHTVFNRSKQVIINTSA